MSKKYEAEARRLFEIRRRLEEISEEMSMAITIEYDLAKRMEDTATALRAAKKKVEEA